MMSLRSLVGCWHISSRTSFRCCLKYDACCGDQEFAESRKEGNPLGIDWGVWISIGLFTSLQVLAIIAVGSRLE